MSLIKKFKSCLYKEKPKFPKYRVHGTYDFPDCSVSLDNHYATVQLVQRDTGLYRAVMRLTYAPSLQVLIDPFAIPALIEAFQKVHDDYIKHKEDEYGDDT